MLDQVVSLSPLSIRLTPPTPQINLTDRLLYDTRRPILVYLDYLLALVEIVQNT